MWGEEGERNKTSRSVGARAGNGRSAEESTGRASTIRERVKAEVRHIGSEDGGAVSGGAQKEQGRRVCRGERKKKRAQIGGGGD